MSDLATDGREGMSTVVRTVARWISPFVVLYGFYILAVGNVAPGGAFASGVVLACGFVLLMLAFGKQAVTGQLSLGLVSVLISVGALIFWLTAASGMLFGNRVFFTNFIAQSDPVGARGAGIITLCEVGIALEVTGALAVLLALLSALRVKGGGTDEEFKTDVEE